MPGPIEVTRHNGVISDGKHSRLVLADFDEFAALLEALWSDPWDDEPRPTRKNQNACLNAALFDDGAPRDDAHVKGFGRVLFLDFDACPMDGMKAALDWASQYSAVLYSSWNDGGVSKKPKEQVRKFRVVVELDRPLQTHELEPLALSVVQTAPAAIGPFDRTTLKPHMPFYVPCPRPEGILPDKVLAEWGWTFPPGGCRHFRGRVVEVDRALRSYVPKGTTPETSIPVEVVPYSDVLTADDVYKLHRTWRQRPVVIEEGKLSWRDMSNAAHTIWKNTKLPPHERKAWAPDGERDTTAFRIAAEITEKYPHKDPTEVLFPLPVGMTQNGGVSEYQMRKKLDAARLRYADKQAEAHRRDTPSAQPSIVCDENRRRLIRMSYRDRDTMLNEEEVSRVLKRLNTEDPDDAAQLAMLEHEGRYHMLQPDGTYSFNSFSLGKVAQNARAALSIFPFIDLEKVTDKGVVKNKSINDLMTHYSIDYKTSCLQLSAQQNTYDRYKRRLTLAPCPIRVKARYSKIAERFLKAVGGSRADVLRNWLSGITRLDLPNSALVLYGDTGAAKSLMARQLARIWHDKGQFTKWAELVSQFSYRVAERPLVFADESVGKDFKRVGSIQLRDFLGNLQVDIERKYVDKQSLEGCIRLMIAINNLNKLETAEDLNQKDLAALGRRLCLINVSSEKVDAFWESLSREEADAFYYGDEMAEHAVWLAENHNYTKPPRAVYWVQGDSGTAQRLMGTSGARGEVMLSIIDALLVARRGGQAKDAAPTTVVTDEGILVNSRLLYTNWDQYDRQEKPPRRILIGQYLNDISSGGIVVRRHGDMRFKYHVITKEALRAVLPKHDIAEETFDELCTPPPPKLPKPPKPRIDLSVPSKPEVVL